MASCSSLPPPSSFHPGAAGDLRRRGFHPFAAEIALLLLLGVLVATGKGQAVTEAVTAFTVGLGEGDSSLARFTQPNFPLLARYCALKNRIALIVPPSWIFCLS